MQSWRSTDDPITDSRLFLRIGAQAVQGASVKQPLQALTLSGPHAAGGRRRPLEAGKDATSYSSGAPFSAWTQVEHLGRGR